MNSILTGISLGDDGVHFIAGALISVITFTLVRRYNKSSNQAFGYGIVFSTLGGLAKEIFDGYIISGRFDITELISTMLGGLIAAWVCLKSFKAIT